MKTDIHKLFAIGIAFALSSGAYGQQSGAGDNLPYNDIETAAEGARYVTGGIGLEAQQRLNAMSDQFNLKIVFTLEEGAYIADVNVAVKDAQGRTVIQDLADGPYFMAKLPPGRYTVEATYNGKKQSHTVTVGEQGTRTAYMRWPSQPGVDFVATR